MIYELVIRDKIVTVSEDNFNVTRALKQVIVNDIIEEKTGVSEKDLIVVESSIERLFDNISEETFDSLERDYHDQITEFFEEEAMENGWYEND